MQRMEEQMLREVPLRQRPKRPSLEHREPALVRDLIPPRDDQRSRELPRVPALLTG